MPYVLCGEVPYAFVSFVERFSIAIMSFVGSPFSITDMFL